MNESEVLSMVNYLDEIYTDFDIPSDKAMELWERGLRDITTKQAFHAIEQHYYSSPFSIKLCHIIQGVREEKLKALLNPDDAWSQAIVVLSGNTIYDDIAPEVRKTIKLLGGIDYLKKQNPNFIRGDFIETYKKVRDGHIDDGTPLLEEPKKESVDIVEEVLKREHALLEERLSKDEGY